MINPEFDVTKPNPFSSESTVTIVFLIVAFFWIALVTIDERLASLRLSTNRPYRSTYGCLMRRVSTEWNAGYVLSGLGCLRHTGVEMPLTV